ncbi:Diacylglycerol kinase [Saezia sanguinis]|uniref:Diacylglycerol kinase n=1 Tax=Saezia sanguinis TaxID=1965230 RepID=A0A433SG20_9BURK|nr:diacylglycerol kinase [Saezia sanguinis]RUS67594.1 Diacylglycerol kinase [Saezia sanguinis]
MTQPDNINKPAPKGWRRAFSTFTYSVKGFKAAWRYEESFRQELFVLLLALPCAWLLARTWVEYVLLLGCIALVLIVELFNSAIEAVVDRISLEHHELSGRAKDIGSAAAMASMLLAAGIWLSLLVIRLSHHWW